MFSSRDLGKIGEDFTAKFLQKRGYKIITRNFRSRFGEIDIVAQEANALVFVEVKTRWSEKFGYPEEAVTPAKLRSIIRTGEYFKLLNPQTPELLRVDVVAVEIRDGRVTSTKIIKNVSLV